MEWLKTPRRPASRSEQIAYDYGVRSAKILADDDRAWLLGLLSGQSMPDPRAEETAARQALGVRMFACWYERGAVDTREALGLPADKSEPPIC